MKAMNLAQVTEAVQGRLNHVSFESLEIRGVSIDSRGELDNKLFIPLKGKNVDGHDFIPMALEQRAVCCFSEKDLVCDKPVIIVQSTRQALMDLARYYKSTLKIRTVAITGSVGKTTTKDVIASILSQKYRVAKTRGNYNNEIGLPLTILELEEEHEFAVLEMGMNHFGEIGRLSRIATPDYAVITNIGVSHIENFGNQEGILRAKCEIFEGMTKNGVVMLNGDDFYLSTVHTDQKIIWYGTKDVFDFYAHQIQQNGIDSTNCKIEAKDLHISVQIPVPGRYMVYSILAGIGLGLLAGLNQDEMIEGIRQMQITDMRMHLVKGAKFTIIDDVYNASPTSVMAAIDVLSEANGQKICILGDMFELGEDASQFHQEIGVYAMRSPVDVLIFVGPLSKFAYECCTAMSMENNEQGQKLYYFERQEDLICNLALLDQTIFEDASCILVKASRGMHLEKTVQRLKQMYEQKVIE